MITKAKDTRRFISTSLFACSSFLIASCATEANSLELIEADRAFAAAVAENGSEAWLSWFAEDGAMIQEDVGEIRGHQRIRETVGYLDDPAFSLTWQPLRADIAASGDLGWTTGEFIAETQRPDGSVNRNVGRYVSIWRRQPDGTWKVVMDLGNPTSE